MANEQVGSYAGMALSWGRWRVKLPWLSLNWGGGCPGLYIVKTQSIMFKILDNYECWHTA